MAHIGYSEGSQPTPESGGLPDWLARLTRPLRPPVAAPDRWLVYYPVCLAAVGVLALITGASILLGPALGAPAEGVLGLILGALYLAVSVGLAERRLWAWRMNYWGLLLIQPITVAGVLGLWNVQRFPLLTAWHGALVLLLGLWSVVNMRYFRRRRPLFDKPGPTEADAP